MTPERGALARACFAACALLALASAACTRVDSRPGVPPRHLVLVTIESLRPDHMSAYGYTRSTTRREFAPAQRARGEALSIDELVLQGVSFARASAPSGDARASLASLMSGHAPLALGWSAEQRTLPESALTLAECLASAGYRNAAFCSGPSAAAGSGLEQGFETHRSFAAPSELDPDRAAIQAAGQWLRSAAHAPEPLFLWLHLAGPAPPFDPAPLGATHFDALFADPEYAGSVDGSLASLGGAAAASGAWTGEDLNEISALYDGELARVSHLLLGLMQMLAGLYADQQPRNLLAESIFVLAGTNGEELYQHGRSFGSAHSLHGAALDVPLVLRHPGSMTGSRAFAPVVELQDVLPTLADWLRIDARPSAPWPGRSLLAITDAARAGTFEQRPACASIADEAFAARDGDWRLLWWPERGAPGTGGEVQLYDLVRDPLEIADCAAQHPERVAELRAALVAWRERCASARAALTSSGGRGE